MVQRIAYLMHVHWNWIKQRPHFLFEGLKQFYSVDLYYIRKIYQRREPGNLELLKLPFSARNKYIRHTEKLMNYRLLKENDLYDFIWVTSPIIMQYLPEDFLKGKSIIYDCMDDFLEFDINKRNYRYNFELEKRLISSSDFVFTSSEYLKDKLNQRYGQDLKIEPFCVNNGINDKFISQSPIRRGEKGLGPFNILYIGTISYWFDFELILKVLEVFPDIIVTLVGPAEIKIPQHPRLKIVGAVNHDLLPDFAGKADAFIMPFKLSNLIKAVDPVKMYEYISFQKPIISIRYEEMHKFNDFALLYSTENELINYIELIKSGTYKMYSVESALNFLKENTWDARVKVINKLLNSAI